VILIPVLAKAGSLPLPDVLRHCRRSAIDGNRQGPCQIGQLAEM